MNRTNTINNISMNPNKYYKIKGFINYLQLILKSIENGNSNIDLTDELSEFITKFYSNVKDNNLTLIKKSNDSIHNDSNHTVSRGFTEQNDSLIYCNPNNSDNEITSHNVDYVIPSHNDDENSDESEIDNDEDTSHDDDTVISHNDDDEVTSHNDDTTTSEPESKTATPSKNNIQSNNEIKIDLDVYNKSEDMMDIYENNKEIISTLMTYRNNVQTNWLYQKN